MVWTRSVSRNTRRQESGDYCSSPVVLTADAQGGWEASEGAWESRLALKSLLASLSPSPGGRDKDERGARVFFSTW